MATWDEFAAIEPVIATLVEQTFRRYRIAYMATVSANNWPRVHPISPVVIDGQIYIGIIPSSPKRGDLDRTGRLMLHCLPGPENAEVRMRGVARRLSTAESVILSQRGDEKTQISLDTMYYRLDLREVAMTTYETRAGESRPTPTHVTWREADGYGNG